MLEYQKTMNLRHDASDPWKMLANAVVEMTADDYRRNMTRLTKRGLSMSDMELVTVRSYILECKIFFESDWGYLLSHGLAAVIWEKLQAEFADDLERFEARLPYVQKHRRKLERKRKAIQRRWEKNKSRRKRQRTKTNNEGLKRWNQDQGGLRDGKDQPEKNPKDGGGLPEGRTPGD